MTAERRNGGTAERDSACRAEYRCERGREGRRPDTLASRSGWIVPPFRRSAVPPLLLALLASGATAQDAPSALARAERAYAAVRSVRAEFGQTISNPMLGDPETSTGTLYLQKPDKFAMRFADPAGDRIVADGTWLWAYTPSTVPNQVIRQPVPTSGAATPNLFAQFVERPLERYEATYAGRDTVASDPVELVTLVPRTRTLGFRRATVAISERTGWIRRVAIVEDSGQHRTLVLTSLEPNAEIPAAEVTFSPPRGAKVVTP